MDLNDYGRFEQRDLTFQNASFGSQPSTQPEAAREIKLHLDTLNKEVVVLVDGEPVLGLTGKKNLLLLIDALKQAAQML